MRLSGRILILFTIGAFLSLLIMEHKFKRLNIWKRAMDLAESIYDVTNQFPTDEKSILISQMKRCSLSIPSNIAEGTSCATPRHISHYLRISIGSIYELQTQLNFAHRRGFVNDKNFNALEKEMTEIKSMIFGFRDKILKS